MKKSVLTKKGFKNGENDSRRGIDFTGVTCVFFCHDGKNNLLMHKRSKNCRDEQGNWDSGAGALELHEDPEDSIRREVKEEYGADPIEIQFVTSNSVHRLLADKTPTHWIVMLYVVKVDPRKVKNNEPYKIDEIGWFKPDKLPTPLHSQILINLAAIKKLGIIV